MSCQPSQGFEHGGSHARGHQVLGQPETTNTEQQQLFIGDPIHPKLISSFVPGIYLYTCWAELVVLPTVHTRFQLNSKEIFTF